MIREKFEVKRYEVVENWLPDLVFMQKRHDYLTKSEVFQTIYTRLEDNRGDNYSFYFVVRRRGFISATVENKRTVRVESDRIVLLEGTKEKYEVQGIMPSSFDKFADHMAWLVSQEFK